MKKELLDLIIVGVVSVIIGILIIHFIYQVNKSDYEVELNNNHVIITPKYKNDIVIDLDSLEEFIIKDNL